MQAQVTHTGLFWSSFLLSAYLILISPLLLLAVLLRRPSPGLTPREEEGGLVVRSPLVPTQRVGLDPLTHSSIPQASQKPASFKLETVFHFKASGDSTQALMRISEGSFLSLHQVLSNPSLYPS